MNTSKYTFLLPAYKAKFFAEALESIKNQTYKEFVCLVSDDCSPEDLKSIFDEIVGVDSRFTFRRNNENMGRKSLVSHWNLLVDLCETEFFIMASDDDVYEPNFLKEIDKLTERYPTVDLFRGRVKCCKQNEIINEDPLLPEYENQIDFLCLSFRQKRIVCVANYVYKTAVFCLLGKFPELPLAWGSDEMSLIPISKNGVCHTKNIEFTFRSSDINISNIRETKTRIKKLQARYQISLLFDHLCESIDTNGTLKSALRLKEYINNFSNANLNILYQGASLLQYDDWKSCYALLKKKNRIKGSFKKLSFVWAWVKVYYLSRKK